MMLAVADPVRPEAKEVLHCLLYTSDAADEEFAV